MTTLIIKSDSEKKTNLLIQFAEELGLSAKASVFEELNSNSVGLGIGRKATDEEMIDYLEKNNDEAPIDLEIAFSKYLATTK